MFLLLLAIGLLSNLGHSSTSREIYSFGRIASQTSAYENVTMHEGDLTINGTETYLIENCTYVQTGNIMAQDWTTLILKNSRLIINQLSSPDRYTSEVYVQVNDSAQLNIQNATIESGCWAGIIMSNSATANITMLTHLCGGEEISGDSIMTAAKSALSSVSMSDRVKVSISSSRIGVLRLLFDRYSSAGIVDLKPGFCEYWRLHENQTVSEIIHPYYDLVIENTEVDGWSLSVEHDATLTIMNSTLADLSLRIHDATLQLSELHTGYIADWSLRSVRLTNSVISNWFLGIDNSEVAVSNSTVGFWIVGDANATFKDSTILDIEAWEHVGSITFEGVKNEVGRIRVARSNTLISGDAKFGGTVDDFVSSNLTRNFNVIVKDAYGYLVSNGTLKLKSKDDVLLWNGTADSSGKADFNLTFTDSNYTEALKLETFKEGFYNVTEQVEFLSNTPILINLTQKPLGDVNEDRVVNILDISLVAFSFGCKPSDARWSERADLNKDGIIDIVDIALVAKDYGKTI